MSDATGHRREPSGSRPRSCSCPRGPGRSCSSPRRSWPPSAPAGGRRSQARSTGTPFKNQFMPYMLEDGRRRYAMAVNKAVRAEIGGKGPGDTVEFVLRRDDTPRGSRPPLATRPGSVADRAHPAPCPRRRRPRWRSGPSPDPRPASRASPRRCRRCAGRRGRSSRRHPARLRRTGHARRPVDADLARAARHPDDGLAVRLAQRHPQPVGPAAELEQAEVEAGRVDGDP